jgi:uncharacterized protein (DUF2147 family)
MKILKNIFTVLIFSFFSFNSFAQTNVTGNWSDGEQNTVIKIVQSNEVYMGKIVSSDNPKAEIGKLMVKDLKKVNGEWKGKVYSPKRKEWYDAEFIPKGNKLLIEVSVGWLSKTVEWIKK